MTTKLFTLTSTPHDAFTERHRELHKRQFAAKFPCGGTSVFTHALGARSIVVISADAVAPCNQGALQVAAQI